jgi:competence ComEA-like helix-hairpin-helix protein
MARYKHDTRHWIKDYFTFSKWQRRAIVLFLIIIIAAVLLPAYYRWANPLEANQAEPIVLKQVEELVAWQGNDSSDDKFIANESWREPTRTKASNTATYFPFDPNTATAEEWLKLGVRPKTVQTILNYRNKGGKFKKPEDLLKLYGLPKEQAAALMPYVTIAPTETGKPFYKRDSFSARPAYTKNITPVDINQSDTTAWIALPGIGSKLAARIINFREKLGGFYSINQVAETYALPDSTFQKIRPRLILTEANVKKININNTSADELKTHPYIRWNFANAIVQYRNQHGEYQSVDDLLRIAILNATWLDKVRPYLSIR